MNTAEHRVQVLTAIAEDKRATPGERNAARIALDIHRKRLIAVAPASEPISTPVVSADAVSRDSLLVYHDRKWWLSVGGSVAGEWVGNALIVGQRDYDEAHYFGEAIHRTAHDWSYAVTMCVDCTQHGARWLLEFFRLNQDTTIMIETGGQTMLFTARVQEIENSYMRNLAYPAIDTCVSITFATMRQSQTFASANASVTPRLTGQRSSAKMLA